ncbi:ferritin-like domain-containing protein [Stenotrophomonas sp. ATs4]|uniref:ferritin-like domain-containing protein n=1 Tax=Stenotrophomonas sp. ATs4 TaxID=3402766 RepID=UPI003F7130E6
MADPNNARSERLLKWLQDAYAMEQEAETMMKAMASRIENHPQLAARISQHVQETQGQAASLRECIEALGGSVPTAKGLFAGMTAAIHAAGNSLMEDEIVKSVGIAFGFENTEIATYRALVIAAERAAAPDIAAVCGQILQEEIAMARWLEDHQDGLAGAFLNRDEMPGAQAKR